GALIGMFPFDEVLRDWLRGRAGHFERCAAGAGAKPPPYTRADVDAWWADRAATNPDPDAFYARELTLDLSTVAPHVAGPNEVKAITPLPAIEPRRVRVDKAYLMSCVNARLEDLALAASVVRGKKIAPGVEFYLAAASSEVQSRAKELGY